MHSSTLRGSDFEIVDSGTTVSHADFFAQFNHRARVGVVAPNRFEGIGAITLLLAHTTAFYDYYRTKEKEFSVWPDYFTFQNQIPVADYRWCDIWPPHRNVAVPESYDDRLKAITDRGINILLVPDTPPTERDYESPQLGSARRNVDCCYLYSKYGDLPDSDLTIRCAKEPLVTWGNRVFETETVKKGDEASRFKNEWKAEVNLQPMLIQSFKRIELDEALARL